MHGSHKAKKPKKNKNFKIPLILGLIILFIISIYTGSKIKVFQKSGSSESTALLEAKKINDLCKDSTDKDHCFGNSFYQLTKKTDLKNAVNILSNLQKIDPQNSNGCHFIAHKVSLAEVEKDPAKWGQIAGQVSATDCTGGFLHGVIEAHMATDPDFTINEESFKKICDDVYRQHRTWFAWRGCVHNMGHLMLVENEGNIGNAIKACDKIEHPEIQYECLSGAFMERITGENLKAHGMIDHIRSWDEKLSKDTEVLCGKYTGLQARACWRVISYVYFATSNHDPKGLYEKCQRAPVKEMADECFIYGAGNLVVTTRFDRNNILKVCHQFELENPLFEPCMNQIIGSLLTSTKANLKITTDMCSKTYTEFKSACYSDIVNTLRAQVASAEIIKKTCEIIQKEFRPRSCSA